MNRTALKLSLGAAVALLGSVPFAVGAVYQSVQTRRDDSRWPGLGEQVEVDGRLVHVRRMGTENPGPTVLFESGLSSPLEMWSRVQAAVAEVAPTVAYDRAGIGWSQASTQRRTATQITDELDRLLEVLDITGPLVLVGHSYGGMLLRAFAQRHPEQIAGVVLIDAAHPEQLERSARQRLGLPLMRASVRSSLFWSRLGRMRMKGARTDTQLDGLGDLELNTIIARMMSTRNWKTSDAEIDAWLSHVVDEVRDTVLPADVPLFVLTAGDTEDSDPVHGELQRELAAMTAAGVHQLLPKATHLGLLCAPESARVAAAAVTEVVDAVRNGRTPKTVEAETTGTQS